jgi:hypothetical protein
MIVISSCGCAAREEASRTGSVRANHYPSNYLDHNFRRRNMKTSSTSYSWVMESLLPYRTIGVIWGLQLAHLFSSQHLQELIANGVCSHRVVARNDFAVDRDASHALSNTLLHVRAVLSERTLHLVNLAS